MERGEPFAGAAGERDDAFALVEFECLPVRSGSFVGSARGFEYLGEVGECLAAPAEASVFPGCVDRFAGEPFRLGVVAAMGA